MSLYFYYYIKTIKLYGAHNLNHKFSGLSHETRVDQHFNIKKFIKLIQNQLNMNK
jgi:hypothetical protein